MTHLSGTVSPQGRLLNIFLILHLGSCFIMGGTAAQANASPNSGPASPQIGDPSSFPEIVARVNDAAIRKSELIDRAKAVQTGMGLPSGDMPLGVYRIILDELVDGELLYQASRVRKLEAHEDEVDRQYLDLQSRFPSEEAFSARLSSQSVTPERLKELLHRDLSVQKLIDTELLPRVSVSPDAKRRFYEENKEEMEQPEQLRLSHILARVKPEASAEDQENARRKIERLRQDIVQQGADFAALAREHSDDPASREDGGELLIERGQAQPPFEEAAFGLEPGAVSEVIETRFGYHIIKLHERIPAREASYEEVEGMIQQYLEEQELQQVIKAEVKELRSQATIEVFI